MEFENLSQSESADNDRDKSTRRRTFIFPLRVSWNQSRRDYGSHRNMIIAKEQNHFVHVSNMRNFIT